MFSLCMPVRPIPGSRYECGHTGSPFELGPELRGRTLPSCSPRDLSPHTEGGTRTLCVSHESWRLNIKQELSCRPVQVCYCDRLSRLYFWASSKVKRGSFLSDDHDNVARRPGDGPGTSQGRFLSFDASEVPTSFCTVQWGQIWESFTAERSKIRYKWQLCLILRWSCIRVENLFIWRSDCYIWKEGFQAWWQQ